MNFHQNSKKNRKLFFSFFIRFRTFLNYLDQKFEMAISEGGVPADRSLGNTPIVKRVVFVTEYFRPGKRLMFFLSPEKLQRWDVQLCERLASLGNHGGPIKDTPWISSNITTLCHWEFQGDPQLGPPRYRETSVSWTTDVIFSRYACHWYVWIDIYKYIYIDIYNIYMYSLVCMNVCASILKISIISGLRGSYLTA